MCSYTQMFIGSSAPGATERNNSLASDNLQVRELAWLISSRHVWGQNVQSYCTRAIAPADRQSRKALLWLGMSCHSAISLIPHKFPLKLPISACSNPHQYCLSSKSASVHSFPQVVKKNLQITRLKFHTKVVFSGPLWQQSKQTLYIFLVGHKANVRDKG